MMREARMINVRRREISGDGWQLELREAEQLVSILSIRSGAEVADLLAGQGCFSLALSARVGRAGIVHALDLSTDIVRFAENGVIPEQIRPTRWIDNHLPIPDGCLDYAVGAFCLGELDHPVASLTDLRRALRPGASVAIFEWRQRTAIGIHLPATSSPAACELMLDEAGFETGSGQAVSDKVYLVLGRRRL
ncbi:MAG TPA: class I SAM-dependent methyltransferase [Gemmatimonadaceae bacterium]